MSELKTIIGCQHKDPFLFLEIIIQDDSGILKYIVSAYRKEDLTTRKIPFIEAVEHIDRNKITLEKETSIIQSLFESVRRKFLTIT